MLEPDSLGAGAAIGSTAGTEETGTGAFGVGAAGADSTGAGEAGATGAAAATCGGAGAVEAAGATTGRGGAGGCRRGAVMVGGGGGIARRRSAVSDPILGPADETTRADSRSEEGAEVAGADPGSDRRPSSERSDGFGVETTSPGGSSWDGGPASAPPVDRRTKPSRSALRRSRSA